MSEGRQVQTAYDVVVVGSGAAGLSAAIAAADSGGRVLVLEKADKLGGASAVSGGILWVPCNHLQSAAGIKDSAEDALVYLEHLALGRAPTELIETFVARGAAVIQYLDERTPLDVAVRATYPDYYPEAPGGRAGGRCLDNLPFDTTVLGDWRPLLRTAPTYLPITAIERDRWGRLETGWDAGVMELIESRLEAGIVTFGTALVGSLLRGCIDRGVDIAANARVNRLVRADGGVGGVVVEIEGQDRRIEARRGVVLASGGFEWNDDLAATFLPGPRVWPLSPPSNEGDGLRMAMEAGCSLGNMSEAWWFPAVRLGDETYDERPLCRMLIAERSLPGSIIVNAAGRRFIDESHEYNAIGRAFQEFEPVQYRYRGVPAFLVFDATFRRTYPVFGVQPTLPDENLPEWIVREESLEALARTLDLPADRLVETVDRFNRSARQGMDPDFARGESAFDREEGDKHHRPNPCLAPLDAAPYYAVRVLPGVLGTKGGPRIDRHARVLDLQLNPIAGLYAAGNVAASVAGAGYAGAGATLAPAVTFGFIAGQDAMSRSPIPGR
jgi:succinate dehydrogenase/fumarate reductase flavoprotein subunit